MHLFMTGSVSVLTGCSVSGLYDIGGIGRIDMHNETITSHHLFWG